ncbi:MAG: hypothetical protein Q9208_008227 [Pyrenodesmia sp. 3 TL-2023]
MATMMQDTKLQLPASCDPPGPNNPPEQLVWVVFGASGHIGRSIVKVALFHNDLVIAVGQEHEDTIPSMQSSFQSSLDHCLPLLCDVRVRPTVDAVIQQAIAHLGRIDIIANCTGYGVIGACEDQDDYDIRNQFETNFFGTVNILHASLPYFRTRHLSPSSRLKEEDQTPEEPEPTGGRYLIFSSTSGALGVPGLGPYSATRHAVEGLIESMLYETHAFNIKATLVEPGYLRRDDSDTPPSPDPAAAPAPQTIHPPPHHTNPASSRTKSSTHFLIKHPHPSSPYADPSSPANHARRMVQWLGDGNRQPTSAARSAELVWLLGHCRFPPLRLLLGGFAVESVRDRLRCVIEEVEDWKHLAFGEEGGEDEGREGGVVVEVKEEEQEEEEEEEGMDDEGDAEGESEDGDGDGDGDGDAEGEDTEMRESEDQG